MDRLPDEISQLEQRALLHAAGELPAEDAAAFERELEQSGEARQAFEAARVLLAEMASALGALRANEAVAERSVRRAHDRAAKVIYSWVDVERESRVLASTRRHPLAEGMVWRYARWPLAAAAILVVGLVIWTFGTEPAANRDVAVGLPTAPVSNQGQPPNTTAPVGTVQLDQIAALFDNPSREGSEVLFAGGLSDELAALRLLEEPDYE